MQFNDLDVGIHLLNNFNVLWTFMLLNTRFIGMMSLLPGIGGGAQGLKIRFGGTLLMALASLPATEMVPPPDNIVMMGAGLLSEMVLGAVIAFIPSLLIAGAQTAGQLSSTTMGLGASQLFDPSMGASVSGLAKLFGDMVVLVFLLVGGHYVVIKAVSGLGGEIIPGTFLMGGLTTELLINRTAHVFHAGVMISAPVIVALLLTQFVMGLITKAVPTVNIFIVSFPLTIGIGLVLSALSLPDLVALIDRDVRASENSILVLLEETEHREVHVKSP